MADTNKNYSLLVEFLDLAGISNATQRDVAEIVQKGNSSEELTMAADGSDLVSGANGSIENNRLFKTIENGDGANESPLEGRFIDDSGNETPLFVKETAPSPQNNTNSTFKGSNLPLETELSADIGNFEAFIAGYMVDSSLEDAYLQDTEAGAVLNLPTFRSDSRFQNIDGRGFSVVVIDTGADLDHPFFGPDLRNNTTGANAPDGIADRIVYQYDFADNDADASDVNGHGSNVASIVGGNFPGGGALPSYQGMATGANLIILKVFSNTGSGSFANIERALQWTVNNATTYNIASVNMSLGDGGNYNTIQRRYNIADEISTLASRNVALVSASGNAFFSFNSLQGVSYPAADPNAIAVGAVYDGDSGGWSYGAGASAFSSAADQITPFSQRSTTLSTVFAPGAPILGANQSGGTNTLHGTSQASPFVAGAVALAQQLATQTLGRRLTVPELNTLFRTTGTTIVDNYGDRDNVNNTGASFSRLDVVSLGNAILNMAPVITPTISIAPSRISQNEGNSGTLAYSFTVNLDRASNRTVSLLYSTDDGTATVANNDYVDNDGTLTFAPGETSKTVTVLVNGDTVVENDESFFLRLNSATNATINATANQGEGVILNEDIVPPAPSGFNVTFNGNAQNYTLQSLASYDIQDIYSVTSIDNNALTIAGNSWKRIDIPAYTITANTVLEFEFRSTRQGEIHGIGLDNDNIQNSNRLFVLYGTEQRPLFSNISFRNYGNNSGSGTTNALWVPYRIAFTSQMLRTFTNRDLTTTMNSMFFSADDDLLNPATATPQSLGNSQFRNIRLYENLVPTSNSDALVQSLGQGGIPDHVLFGGSDNAGGAFATSMDDSGWNFFQDTSRAIVI
jgi:Subtilase family/Calx-beta domain